MYCIKHEGKKRDFENCGGEGRAGGVKKHKHKRGACNTETGEE